MKAAWTERIAKWGAPVLSAVTLFLAFYPVHFWPFGFIALVPWFKQLKLGTAKYAVRSGFVFGFMTGLMQLFMIQKITVVWTQSFALSLAPYLISACIFGAFHAFLGRVVSAAFLARQTWIVPLVWAGWEVGRSYLPGFAFPWALIASPFYNVLGVNQIAYFGTIYAVSAWLVVVNLALLTISEEGLNRKLLHYAIGIFVPLVLGLIRMAMPQQGTPTILSAGQPGVDMAYSSMDDQDRQLAIVVPALADDAKAAKAKLLILPEGLVVGGDTIPPETSFMVPEGIPLIFGGKRGIKPVYQAAFGYDGKWSYADKTRLVPFGEYFPGRNIFPAIAQAFKLPSGDVIPADKVSTVKVGGFQVGALICFEGLFYDVAQVHADQGAQILAAMCIDDWYFGTPAPQQLMTASSWRAIETGLPVVRAAGLGFTMIVDQRGRVVAQAPLKAQRTISAEVLVPTGASRFPLVRIFPLGFLSIFVAWTVWSFWKLRPVKKAITVEQPAEA